MRPQREAITTHLLPNGAGPAVQNVRLSIADQSVVDISAWISNFGGSNVWVFEGRQSLAYCQNAVGLTSVGRVDAFPITGAGETRLVMSSDTRELTIFWEAANASGQSQALAIRIREFTA